MTVCDNNKVCVCHMSWVYRLRFNNYPAFSFSSASMFLQFGLCGALSVSPVKALTDRPSVTATPGGGWQHYSSDWVSALTSRWSFWIWRYEDVTAVGQLNTDTGSVCQCLQMKILTDLIWTSGQVRTLTGNTPVMKKLCCLNNILRLLIILVDENSD